MTEIHVFCVIELSVTHTRVNVFSEHLCVVHIDYK